MAKSTPKVNLDRIKQVSFTEFAEGGGFGPTSFRGYPVAAAYTAHRFGKEFTKPTQNPAYFLALYVKFHVLEVLESENGWDPDEHNSEFEYWWKIGSKSLQYFYATNDGTNPAGINKDGSPLTLEDLDLMAAGRVSSGGLVTFDGDPESLHGRWFIPREGIPDSKKKIEAKSGFALHMTDSIPAIEAVDPSLIVTTTDKNGKEFKGFAVNADGPDGLPLGAHFWLGLNGTWDIQKVALDIKDKATGESTKVDQRYLYLTTFDGRVEVDGEEGGEAAESATPATKKTTTTAAKKSAAAPTPDSADEPLDDKILRLIGTSLPPKGAVARQNLALTVVRDSGEFTSKDSSAAMVAANRIIMAFPNKTLAKEMAEMGEDMAPAYIYDPESQKVERFNG